MKNPFLEFLKATQPSVWKVVESRLPVKAPREHYLAVREYPERKGKYLRPGLVLLAAEFFGGKPGEAMLTAAAMQLSEEWLLVHDDVEDGSPVRRGGPSLPAMLGPEIAVNAGDALHILTWKLLGENVQALGPERGWKVFRAFAEILLATTEGQFIELAWRRAGTLAITEREYLDMASRKSARYSAVGPVTLGALATGTVSRRDLRLVSAWAEPFGLAFQIRDDVLSLEGSEQATGKADDDDILEGKRTIMLIHLLRHATRAERKEIVRIYGLPRDEKGGREVACIKSLMRDHGSIAYANEKALAYARKAEETFMLHGGGREKSRAGGLFREAFRFSAQRSH